MLKEKEYPINSYGPVRTNKDRTCVCCGDTVPAGSSRMMPRNAISCIFGSLLKDDCNIKDEIIDISKHIKEKLISDNHG